MNKVGPIPNTPKATNQLAEAIAHVADAISKKECMLFIGSGFSHDLTKGKIKLLREITESLIAQNPYLQPLHTQITESAGTARQNWPLSIAEIFEYWKADKTSQEISAQLEKIWRYTEVQKELFEDGWEEKKAVFQRIADFGIEFLLTTNVDRLLEDGIIRIVGEDSVHIVRIPSDFNNCLKPGIKIVYLRGRLNDATGGPIFSKNYLFTNFIMNTRIFDSLRRRFSASKPVFLGYTFEDLDLEWAFFSLRAIRVTHQPLDAYAILLPALIKDEQKELLWHAQDVTWQKRGVKFVEASPLKFINMLWKTLEFQNSRASLSPPKTAITADVSHYVTMGKSADLGATRPEQVLKFIDETIKTFNKAEIRQLVTHLQNRTQSLVVTNTGESVEAVQIPEGALEEVQQMLSGNDLSPWQKLSQLCRWREQEKARGLENGKHTHLCGMLALVKLVDSIRSQLVDGYALPMSELEQTLTAMWSEINKRVQDMLLSRHPIEKSTTYMRGAVAAFLREALWKATHPRSCLTYHRLRGSGLDVCIAVAPPGQSFLTSSFASPRLGFLYFGEEWLHNEDTRRKVANLYFDEFQRLKRAGENITHICLSYKSMGFGKGTWLLRDPIVQLLKDTAEQVSLCWFFENSWSLRLSPGAGSFSGGGVFYCHHRSETETVARGMIAEADKREAQGWVRFSEDARPDELRVRPKEDQIAPLAPVPVLASIRDLIEEVTADRKDRPLWHIPLNTAKSNIDIMTPEISKPPVKLKSEDDIHLYLKSWNYSPQAIKEALLTSFDTTLSVLYRTIGKHKIEDKDNETEPPGETTAANLTEDLIVSRSYVMRLLSRKTLRFWSRFVLKKAAKYAFLSMQRENPDGIEAYKKIFYSNIFPEEREGWRVLRQVYEKMYTSDAP